MNIETEIRSFITEEQFKKLLDFFEKNANKVKEDYQETYYFDGKVDLRIQRNDYFSKIWMKKGVIHDEHREEIEIKMAREEFGNLEKLFLGLGYQVEIKWFRKRIEYKWGDTNVCLDDTRRYGYIIELEKMCDEASKESELEKLKQKLKSLNIELSAKEEFAEKFDYYKANWRELV